jgi:hypothetical protein
VKANSRSDPAYQSSSDDAKPLDAKPLDAKPLDAKRSGILMLQQVRDSSLSAAEPYSQASRTHFA